MILPASNVSHSALGTGQTVTVVAGVLGLTAFAGYGAVEHDIGVDYGVVVVACLFLAGLVYCFIRMRRLRRYDKADWALVGDIRVEPRVSG